MVRADRQEPKVRGEVAVGSVEEGKGRVGSSRPVLLGGLVVVVVVVVVAAALLLRCPSRLFFLLHSRLCDDGDRQRDIPMFPNATTMAGSDPDVCEIVCALPHRYELYYIEQ